ncbi:MAG: tryptophan synthase subunit alpha [Phycisphaeraceae bacterium]|nr:MAG: tryptophan synthase subunit alpha [Phycisphaeraceae bacterium]
MNRVAEVFRGLRESNQKAIMPFLVAGDPSVDSLPGVLRGCERGGASVIEVGIPFSDPIADGPVIAAAMHRALQRGMTPATVFEQIAGVRAEIRAAIVVMVSVSIVTRLGGSERFVRQAAEAGVDGFIFPDAPLEESEQLLGAARDAGVAVSLLVSPTTRPERLAQIAQACTGFVYVLARAGLTGERSDAPSVGGVVGAVRRATPTPVVCGFGVSTADHVREVSRHADGVIVGSAIVRRLAEIESAGESVEMACERLVREFASGLERGI